MKKAVTVNLNHTERKVGRTCETHEFKPHPAKQTANHLAEMMTIWLCHWCVADTLEWSFSRAVKKSQFPVARPVGIYQTTHHQSSAAK